MCFFWICSTTFGTSKSFSFISLSRKFLLMDDVISFDLTNLLLNSGKLRSFSNSSYFSPWPSGVSVPVRFAQKTPLEMYCFFSVNTICCIVFLFCLFWYCLGWLGIRILIFGASQCPQEILLSFFLFSALFVG